MVAVTSMVALTAGLVGLNACSGANSNAATTRDATTSSAIGAGGTSTGISASTTAATVPPGTPDPCALATKAELTALGLAFQLRDPVGTTVPNAGGGTDRLCTWASTGDSGYVRVRVRGDGVEGHARDVNAEIKVQMPVPGIGDTAYIHDNTDTLSVKVGIRAFTVQVSGAKNNKGAAESIGKLIAPKLVGV